MPKSAPAGYDAFMSYSHAADAQFAPFLQRAVQRFAKPWYRLRSVRIFRDQTGLAVTPELWPEIQRALDASRFFILLASPEAAGSEWVRKEVEHWLTLDRPAPLIVVTGGAVQWHTATGDFDWSKTTSLPRSLSGVYRHEPLYLDAEAIKAEDLSERHAKIRSASAQIYSRLTGRGLDEVIGADVREHRRNVSTATAAIAILALSAGLYLHQRAETARQQAIAATRRQLDMAKGLGLESFSRNGGPDAVNVSARDAGRAAMLAVESVNLVPTLEGNDALHAHLALIPAISSERQFPAGVESAALSPDGGSVAVRSNDGAISILPADGAGAGRSISPQADARLIQVATDGRLFGVRGRELVEFGSRKSWSIDVEDPARIRVSPDGQYYATAVPASHEAEALVTVWRTDGAQIGQWRVGRPLSLPIAFSSQATFFAFVDHGRVAVADLRTGSLRRTIETELVEITALAVDRSGDAVLVFGWEPDPKYIIRKNFVLRSFPTTGQSTFRPVYYRGESDPGIGSMAIDLKDGLIAFGGGAPGWVKVLDYVSSATLAIVRDDAMTSWTLAESQQNPAIITTGKTRVQRWSIRREPAEATRPRTVVEADFGPRAALSGNGGRLAVAGIRKETNSSFLTVVDLGSGEQAMDRPLASAPEKLLLSPDGGYVAVWCVDGTVQIISVALKQVVWSASAPTAAGNRGAPLYLAFSPDGRAVVWGRSTEGITVQNLATADRRPVSGPVDGLTAVAVSAKASQVAWLSLSSGSVDRSCPCAVTAIRGKGEGEAKTLSKTPAASGEGPLAGAVAFDYSGERLAVGVSHGSLQVFDVGAHRASLSLVNEGSIDSVAFSGDDRYLLTTGSGRLLNGPEQSEVSLWGLAEGRRLWRSLSTDTISGFGMKGDDSSVVLARSTVVPRTGYLGIAAEELSWRPADLVRIGCRLVKYRLSPEERYAFLSDSREGPCPAPPGK